MYGGRLTPSRPGWLESPRCPWGTSPQERATFTVDSHLHPRKLRHDDYLVCLSLTHLAVLSAAQGPSTAGRTPSQPAELPLKHEKTPTDTAACNLKVSTMRASTATTDKEQADSRWSGVTPVFAHDVDEASFTIQVSVDITCVCVCQRGKGNLQQSCLSASLPMASTTGGLCRRCRVCANVDRPGPAATRFET